MKWKHILIHKEPEEQNHPDTYYIEDENDDAFAVIYGKNAESKAQQITLYANTHKELIDILKEAEKIIAETIIPMGVKKKGTLINKVHQKIQQVLTNSKLYRWNTVVDKYTCGECLQHDGLIITHNEPKPPLHKPTKYNPAGCRCYLTEVEI